MNRPKLEPPWKNRSPLLPTANPHAPISGPDSQVDKAELIGKRGDWKGLQWDNEVFFHHDFSREAK